jgi:hypothetical protein
VLINDHFAGTVQARDTCVLSIPVPTAATRPARAIEVTLRFPDAARPSEVLGSGDHRILGISLHRIVLFQTESVPEKARRPRGAVVSDKDADLAQSAASAQREAFVSARLAAVSCEAFRLPGFDYHAQTVLRTIAGYDPTSFVRFVLAVEAEFGIALQEHEVDQIETMGDVVALVRGKLSVPAESAKPAMAK